ncbi:MAG: LacI family DNA-binding transcriptional regulator, partial [Patescibacteria group bacterium]|nr:LacI family DNA-binding transcriptional regulator [Patescibacteria group bacterium]
MTARRIDSKTARPIRPARLVDVARLANVSSSVAGLVLNQGGGNSRVSNATAERVRQAGRTLNYRPNPAARLLRGKRSHTFGLMVASAGDPLRSFLVEHLDVEAAKSGCQVLIANTVGNPKVYSNRFDTVVEDFTRRRVDGVFCAVHHYWEGDRAALLAAHPNARLLVGIENDARDLDPDSAYV